MEESSIRIRERLKKKLPAERYEHTLGVAYTAVCLAMRYGCDLKKAELAGLLHDCAKQYTNVELFEKCARHGLPISESEMANKSLLHAKLGAFYAKKKYGVEDEEILEAIRVHTTGKPDMSLLDKIIYIADYIEPDRTKQPGLEELRRMAFENLDQALLAILADTIAYLNTRNIVIDSMTQKTYDYYSLQLHLQS